MRANLATIGIIRHALFYLERMAEDKDVPPEIIEELGQLYLRLTKELRS